ncbi:hypothetical protein [Corynebacterium anserum]|uniref:Uncharacterized protein n=1 Tax=Corynebacterium anserum TaxID=2684406 RepID=A0A7G7YMA2_9CORY|nr:hypothetical protein [Corynebacterium anserum]MBC2680979.1 hypothetical protein [Corynebacterium anserum]QNH95622.1 hypothetical protein GP473_02035 [Corynebacterium anserum]
MNFTTTLMEWSEKHSDIRIERWQKRQRRTRGLLLSWRKPRRQKLLIALYFGTLLLGITIAIGHIFWPPLLAGWFLVTISLIVIWSILRITIDSKDDAPIAVLDEYEESVINNWRSMAFNLMSWCGVIGFSILIIFSVTALHADEIWGFDPMLLIYSGALVGLLVYLAIVALPAVGYAMTFSLETELDNEGVTSN